MAIHVSMSWAESKNKTKHLCTTITSAYIGCYFLFLQKQLQVFVPAKIWWNLEKLNKKNQQYTFQGTEAVGLYKWDIPLNESRRCLKSNFLFSKTSVIVDVIKKSIK